MMKNHESIHILILRLFSGEADSSEKNKIAKWLELSGENKKFYTDLQDIWLSSGIKNNTDEYDVENAINIFRSNVHKKNSASHKIFAFKEFAKYAAILFLAFAVPISYYYRTKEAARQSMTTIACAFGDKSTIILPDSTIVWLNSGSRLSFNSDFKHVGRVVQIDGEAYFSVSKDKKHPFRVKTSDIEIAVLGTQFNVKAYREDSTIVTTLVEGSLQINSLTEQLNIKKDQKIVFNKGNKTMELKNLKDTSSDTDWKNGRLIFRNESLAEMESTLERWFDVDIVFADDQVKQRRFTGTLERESILEVVSYIDHSKYVTCKIEGNKIIIKTKNR
jgi:transmembrane sensor